MDELLFLVHRIPYPPNKGDKVRSFHILKALADRYRVRLGAFVDDPDDWRHAEKVREYCAEVRLIGLHPKRARLRSVRGFLTGRPLTLPYFFDRRMRSWVDQVLREHDIRRILVYSSAMAQYVLSTPVCAAARRVLDFVDVDSDKWRQYSARLTGPMRLVYRREARRLLIYEQTIAGVFDASVLVSAAEAALFRKLAPRAAARVVHINNGVDTRFFSPDGGYSDPYGAGGRVVVFTGAMDYWANVDAVCWFVAEVFPRIRVRVPDARFYIVGARPDDAVRRLVDRAGVFVTGSVEDIRPYLAHAAVAVAPLRIARGVQNKVLEAMAMAKPVVASPQALDGLELGDPAPLVATDPGTWVTQVEPFLLGCANAGLGAGLRAWVRARYDWDANVRRFQDLLEGVAPAGDGGKATP
ncbi:MAG: sugar transferase [Chromatiales bacterium 21-64-14]|nr:MAG: sugar transferase [Chromatiales bacterium 21-64-14]HQU16071.1 TIGR03087 family PEP-CTERM/XrtA system glycosyltransferase [Gammaproteobacteria bacterium]